MASLNKAASNVEATWMSSGNGPATSMPGTVVDVMVKEGDTVKAGDPVLVIEAMKMENEVPAPIGGLVKTINATKGDSVNPDEALVEIE